MQDLFAGLARTLNHATKPEQVFVAVEDAVRRAIGFRLLTVMLAQPEQGVVQRIHSSNPTAYPVSGKKPFRTTEWGVNLMVDIGGIRLHENGLVAPLEDVPDTPVSAIDHLRVHTV